MAADSAQEDEMAAHIREDEVVQEEEQEPQPIRQRRKLGFSQDHPLGGIVKARVLPVMNRFFSTLEEWTERIWLRLETANEAYAFQLAKAREHNLQAVLGMTSGLLLVFFGRHFIVTFTMIEAFRHGGSDMLMTNLNRLASQVVSIRVATQQDDLLDEDGNGIPDVDEISKRALIKRKIQVAVRSINPTVVQNAVQGLWTSIVSASASVKVEAARSVSLGMSLGNDMDRVAQRRIVPVILGMVQAEAHKWLPSSVTYFCRFMGILLAFLFAAYISIISTSVRGAFLFVANAQAFWETTTTRPMPAVLSEENDLMLVLVLIVIGVPFQILADHHDHIPTPMKVLFLPALTLERVMNWVVSVVKSDAEKFQRAIGGGTTILGGTNLVDSNTVDAL